MLYEPLRPDVATFIDGHFRSIDEIEALAALSDAPERWWDAKLMRAEIGVSLPAARVILDHLASLNLLDIRVTDAVRYRFQPGTPELEDHVVRVIAAYRADRDAVLRLVRRVARRSVRDFADAFRFRKDNGDR